MTAIKFSARKVDDAGAASSQCAVLPLHKGDKLGGVARNLDKASGGAISAALTLGDFAGKSGQSTLLPGAGKIKRILLVGCGDKDKFDRDAAREMAQTAFTALKGTSARDALLFTAGISIEGADEDWLLEMLARNFTAGTYRYTRTLGKPKPAVPQPAPASTTPGSWQTCPATSAHRVILPRTRANWPAATAK